MTKYFLSNNPGKTGRLLSLFWQTVLEILSGATATPISAGGLGGAEGGITMVIKGNDEQGNKAIEYIESIKGTQLPREVNAPDCLDCQNELCSLKDGKKPWC